MVRNADNVRIGHRPGIFGGKGYVILWVGNKEYRLVKHTKKEFSNFLNHQLQVPVALKTIKGRKCWIFENRFYWENEGLARDEIHALLVTRQRRRQQQIENAQAELAMGSQSRQAPSRRSIPDDVKTLVWARDAGRCRNCNSDAELQFDHIIPVSMGGGNSPDNLQILCGPCNRRKSAGLTTRR